MNRIIALVHTHEVISPTFDLNTFRKTFKIDSIDMSKRELMPAILTYLDHALVTTDTLEVRKWMRLN